ncbi:MAG TPA: hypothetical protein VJG64_01935 [Candidatus Paceibacterota bacterium]
MGWILLLAGLFCFLLVLGVILGKDPFSFAIGGVVVLGAICFAAFVLIIGWALLGSH